MWESYFKRNSRKINTVLYFVVYSLVYCLFSEIPGLVEESEASNESRVIFTKEAKIKINKLIDK